MEKNGGHLPNRRTLEDNGGHGGHSGNLEKASKVSKQLYNTFISTLDYIYFFNLWFQRFCAKILGWVTDFGRLKIENNQTSAQLELLNRPLDQYSVLDLALLNVLQTLKSTHQHTLL